MILDRRAFLSLTAGVTALSFVRPGSAWGKSLPKEDLTAQTLHEAAARSVPARQVSALAAGLSPVEIATRVAGQVVQSEQARRSYIADFSLMALLELDETTHRNHYLDWIRNLLRHREYPGGYSFNQYESQLFCSLPFELIRRGQDPQYIAPFIAESRRYQSDVLRAYDGAVSYYLRPFANVTTRSGTLHLDPKTTPVLIDQAQEYASRMAKAGWLSKDPTFYSEAAAQIQILRNALRDPKTGLWAHGRGWYGPPDSLVATKWGRAHAWLLRGLVETSAYLPSGSSERQQVVQVLQALAATLINYQDAEGFWHQVLDRPESFEETSATGLISYDLARAVKQGWLAEKPYRAASIKAFEALAKWKVSAEGAVYGGSATLPPLASTDEYMSWETPINDPHAIAAVIFSASGRMLMDSRRAGRL